MKEYNNMVRLGYGLWFILSMNLNTLNSKINLKILISNKDILSKYILLLYTSYLFNEKHNLFILFIYLVFNGTSPFTKCKM